MIAPIMGRNLRPLVSKSHLRSVGAKATIDRIESLVSHQDVTTTMRILGEIRDDVRTIRELLEDDDGEEEVPEDDG
jgi:hypothetical protein